MKGSIRLAIAAATLALVAPQAAHATPVVSCSDAVAMTILPAYKACLGPLSGNIMGTTAEATDATIGFQTTFNSFFNGTWTGKGKSDDGGFGPFTSNPTSGSPTTITFDSPITGWFVIGIKQCSAFSYYLFDAVVAMASVAIDDRGTCPDPSGVGGGFSHTALWTGSGGTGTTLSVAPEPATMMMMGTGLVSLIGLGRSRRRKTA